MDDSGNFAAQSVMWLYYRIPHPAWEAATYFGCHIMSRNWTAPLCDLAAERDPGPSYPVVQGITAAVFDNLSIQVNYSSYMTGGESGTKLEMTNWATMFLPNSAMPNGYAGMDSVLADGGIFRTDMAIEEFVAGFSQFDAKIISNQRERWTKYLTRAQRSCIWDEPHYRSPYPRGRSSTSTPLYLIGYKPHTKMSTLSWTTCAAPAFISTLMHLCWGVTV